MISTGWKIRKIMWDILLENLMGDERHVVLIWWLPYFSKLCHFAAPRRSANKNKIDEAEGSIFKKGLKDTLQKMNIEPENNGLKIWNLSVSW